MENMVELHGTPKEITDIFRKQLSPGKMVTETELEVIVNELLSVMLEYQDCLSDDEWFDIESACSTSVEGFVTSDAKYYINVKASTLLVFLSVIKHTLNDHLIQVPVDTVLDIIGEFAASGLVGSASKLYHRIDNAVGEGCILLEAAKARKHGIDSSYFARFKGECINNHIPCGFRDGYLCGCDTESTKQICEDLVQENVLQKRKSRYYYTDLL